VEGLGGCGFGWGDVLVMRLGFEDWIL
jgi:hypothetical protein